MEQDTKIKQKKRVGKQISSYHFYYKRKGVYTFLIKNTAKLVVGLSLFAIAILLLRHFAPGLENGFHSFLENLTPVSTLIFFFLSESLLGLIPPDIFIIWSQNFDFPFLMVGFLGLLSYLGGITSYFMGSYISHLPKVEKWIQKKFLDQLTLIRKWGGVLIVFAALFPLPFSSVCVVAGTVRFPIVNFLLLGLFRFIRFFGYAIFLFQVF